jgi:hypothetical protein
MASSPQDSPEKEIDATKADANHLEEAKKLQDVDFKNLDKKIDHKFDLHIVPWVFGIW